MASPKKIMIVDDDADHLLAVNLIFQKRGYQVLALLGCESLEMLEAEVGRFSPDLIFMDHEMPVVCGSDAVKMLKAHPVYKKIPVIYFSAHDRIEALARAAGADRWLKKPYVLERLMEVADLYLS
ncbi:MAG TPA: response regulator [Puia sp.]|jgi:CheY-like chemotaxis protein|nr:response regulator [Puia sp.]